MLLVILGWMAIYTTALDDFKIVKQRVIDEILYI